MASPRSRSPSPQRSEPQPKKAKTTGGFKWKEKKSSSIDEPPKSEDRYGGKLQRGYRDRSPRRDSYRQREFDDKGSGKERDREGGRWRNDEERRRDTGDRYGDRDERRREADNYHPPARDSDTTSSSKPTASGPPQGSTTEPGKQSTKPKKPKKPTAPSEPMIIVNINDRLGTKAAIPCLASDSIKAFKAVVAAHIGRQPHEILLKRQGERPFKDALSLADYGVSSGVQLDLELDTGD